MKDDLARPMGQQTPSTLWWSGILLVAVLICAWIFVYFFTTYGENLERRALLTTASTAAAAFDQRIVAGLAGEPADEGTAAFREVHAGLDRIHAAIPNSRFAYLMALHGADVVFLADGEASNSPDYSPPGEVYHEASDIIRQVFATGTPASEGPLADHWGDWVSGFAPLIDPATGKVVALFGVDISAADWEASVARFRWLGIAVSGLLALIILLFRLAAHRQQRLSAGLATANRIVESSTTLLYRVAGGPTLPITFISSNIARLGYEPSQFIGPSDFYRSLIHPDDVPRVDEVTRHLLEGSGSTSIQFRVRAKDGAYHWVENQTRAVRDANGRLLAAEGTLVDVTEGKAAEAKLQFAHTLLTTTMENSPDAILVVDKEARIISANRRFASMWGIAPELVEAGYDEPVLAAVASAMRDPEGFIARVKYLYAHPDEGAYDEMETQDGRFIERHSGQLRTPAGRYIGRVWFFRDISGRKRAEAEIRHRARHDVLTGLANRRVFMETVQQAMGRVERGDKRFAVLYLDLDHFKDVNDTLGHPAGDELLCAVAERLRLNARDTDLVARFGGDEFAVLAAVINEPADAASLAEKLIAAINKPIVIQGNDIRSGVSIGIAVHEPGEASAEALLSHADVALYRAKADGRAGYRFFTEAMDAEVRARVSLTAELRQAIAEDELFLLYQPQVEVGSGNIVGVEALIRWRHPTRGVLDPEAFIAVAEKTGLIVPIDRWVTREACRQGKAWMDAGVERLQISVNVSGVRFKLARELEKDINAALADSGLPADWLCLELTEGVLMEASRAHNEVLLRLHQAGIKLAVDDFGTGYSSLDYLRRYPTAQVKIAKEFVCQIATEPRSAAIVRAIIGLFRELGMTAIAEGVETVEQLELLRGWGCSQVQGFYFAQALGPAELLPLLRRGNMLSAAPEPAKDSGHKSAA